MSKLLKVDRLSAPLLLLLLLCSLAFCVSSAVAATAVHCERISSELFHSLTFFVEMSQRAKLAGSLSECQICVMNVNALSRG